MLALGFVLVLIARRARAQARVGSAWTTTFTVDNFGWALLAALIVAAVSVVLEVDLRDERRRHVHAARRPADRPPPGRRRPRPTCPGSSSSRSTGSRCPVLRRAMRDGNAPNMARWLAEGTHRLAEWETDLSSQTGASQAGILLGSNDDIPAFRWVEKETGDADDVLGARRLRRDRAAARDRHRPARRRRRQPRQPALRRGRRGDPHRQPHGGREEARTPATARSSPTAFNVTRALVLFGWEVILEWTAALRAIRRDVRPRGHRGGIYPFMRGGDVRDRPRPDRLRRPHGHDARAARPSTRRSRATTRSRTTPGSSGPTRSRRCASSTSSSAASTARAATRRGRTRSSSSPTTARRRARRSSSGTATASTSWSSARSSAGNVAGGRRRRRAARDGRPRGRRGDRAPDKPKGKRAKNDVSDRDVVVLGSGNLGLVYLMEEPRRLTLEEIDERHPRLIPALRAHPHVGWLLVRSVGARRRSRSAPRGAHYLADGTRRGRGPARAVLAERAPAPAAHRRLRARRRHHGRQLLRPRARGGLRVRGADLVPRRHRRPADAAVHPPPAHLELPPSRSSAPRACTACSRAGAASSRARRPARPSRRRSRWSKRPPAPPRRQPYRRVSARRRTAASRSALSADSRATAVVIVVAVSVAAVAVASASSGRPGVNSQVSKRSSSSWPEICSARRDELARS